MEDPKRLRTKLRLDLNDVAQQIEELEDLLEDDKSPENIEAHAKLVEYEKKLRQQYEQMTGLTLEDATSMKVMITPFDTQPQKFSRLLGLIAGFLFAWGFYNTILQAIVGFNPQDLIDYYSGTGQSVTSIDAMGASFDNDDNRLFIILPLGVSAILFLLSALFSKNDNKLLNIIEALGYAAFSGVFLYLILFPPSDYTVGEWFEENMVLLGGVYLVAGLLSLLSALGKKKGRTKILTLISGILLIWGAVQVILISLQETALERSNEFLWQYPWFALGAVVAGVTYILTTLTK